MEVIYTRHARSRMRWRNISQDEVEKTLAAPERRETIGPNRLHYFRHIGKRYIRVTCVTENQTRVVITVVDKSD